MKKNIPLFIGLAIPVFMILFVAGSIYLPELLHPGVPPRFNFLYSSGGDYDHQKQYSVKEGKLEKQEIQYPKGTAPFHPEKPTLFVYDVSKNENREITFEEAAKLPLNSDKISSDGFKIDCANRNDWGLLDLFFGLYSSYSDCKTVYILGHHFTKKINKTTPSKKWRYQFKFLGWIAEPTP